MNLTPRDIAKKVAIALVQYGCGTIVYSTIKNNVKPTPIDHKIAVGAASMALGGVVSKAAAQYVEEKVDDLFDKIDEIMIKKNQE
jgi:hypothetical protein